MHYYQKNIGDYRADTAHLSLLEHGVYNWLIDTYYLNETPLPSDEKKLMRMALARTEDEQEAVRTVLDEFFVLTDDGWEHTRCDEEIEKFHEKSDKARASVQKRWGDTHKKPQSKNERNTDVIRPNNERNTNQEPITINQEPLTKHTQNTTEVCKEGSLENQKSGVCEKSESQILLGEIAQALKSEGMSATGMNLNSPVVAELIAKGATAAMFAGAYREAVDKGIAKPFPYSLKIIEAQVVRAKNLQAQARASPKKPRSFNDVSLAEAVAQQQAQAQEYQALEHEL